MKPFKRDADIQPPVIANAGPIPTSLIEVHGPILAQVIYEQQQTNRAEAVRRMNLLNDKLRESNAKIERHESIALARLPPLRKRMDDAYTIWFRACEDLESARVAIDAELSPLREENRKLVDEIRGPLLHSDKIAQWQKPKVELKIDGIVDGSAFPQKP